MARNNNMICPVCGQEMSGSICCNCGWVHINMPSKVDVRVEDFQRRRLEAHKKAYESLQNQISSLRKTAAESAKEIERKVRQDESVRFELKKVETRCQNLEDDLRQTHQMLEEYKQKALEAANAKPEHKLKGIALITGDDVLTRMFLPVYEGMNTYGSAPSDGKHHFKITMMFRGLKFEPRHFAVETYRDRLVFHDLSHSITESASPIPATGMKATPAMKFRLNDKYYIIISEI